MLMHIVLLVLGLVGVALIAWRWPWLRRDLLVGAFCAAPFVLLAPLASRDWQGWFGNGLSLGLLLALGALVSVFYTRFIHRYLTPVVHPRRGLLAWLTFGPAVTFVVYFAAHYSLIQSAAIGLGVQLVLVLLLHWRLVWDVAASMAGMALFYVALYLFFGQMLHVTSSGSGLYFFVFPLEDILRVATFGALWGPLFAAFRALTRGDTPFDSKHHIPKQVAVGATLAVLIAGSLWVEAQFIRVPKVIAASPTANTTLETITTPLTIQLDRPLDRAAVSVQITPSIEGELSFEDSYLQRTFVRRIVFTPRSYFQPDTTYSVAVTSLKNVLGQKAQDYSYEFRTPSLPVVTEVGPADGATGAVICDPLHVTLSQPASSLADITFQLEPAVEFSAEPSSDGKTYTIKPKECLAQSQSYTITVLRRLMLIDQNGTSIGSEEPVAISKTSFATKGAPGIASVTPQGGGVLTDTKELTVGFTEAMEQAELSQIMSIAPSVAGSWRWQDAQTAVYTFADKLPFDTRYTLTLAKGLKDQKGGFLADAAEFSFTTIGHVRVSGVSPYKGSGGVKADAAISVTFDQAVDHESAETRFSIVPTVTGSFTWNDKTMIFRGTLTKDTAYQFSIASGVRSLAGLDLAETYTSSFQTEESSKILNIPVYYQQHNLSCELASLKMALQFKSVNVTEDHLLSLIPTRAETRGATWADPDLYFVGDVNGRQNTTGYGVHAAPIAALARNYRSANVISGWTVQQLAETLSNDNPVVIWGTAGTAKKDSWTTPEGRTVSTWVGEHARTAIGFTGTVQNPTSFYINDPIFGRLKWTPAQLKANWGTFGNMGVEVL